MICKWISSQLSHLESQYIRNLQQQIYFLELENAHLKNQLKKGAGMQPKLIADSELLMEKLMKSTTANQRTQEALKDREYEVDTVLQERHILAERLKNSQDSHVREKEILCQEIVDLRKQLDDSEPDRARKESKFSQIQTELIEATNKGFIQKSPRALQNMCDSLKEQLDYKSRETVVKNSFEMDKAEEAQNIAESIRIIEKQLVEQRGKTRSLVEENGNLRQKLRGLELQARKDKGIADKLGEENAALVTETSQLTAKIAQLESHLEGEGTELPQKYEHVFSELAESRGQQKQLRQELFRVQEELRTEQLKNRNLDQQVNQEEASISQLREANIRLQTEIEALETQARNLSSENQQFRTNKLSTEGKLEELRKALSNKDLELVSLRDRLQTAEQQYRALLEQYTQESAIQDEKCREFEELAQKVKNLSRNIRSSNFLPNSFSPATSNPDEA